MWRGLSLRTIALLLVGPMLIDLLMTCFLFAMNISAVRMGYPPREQAWIGTLLGLGYITGAHLAGKWMTPTRAKWCILVVAPLIVTLGTVSLTTQHFKLYLLISLSIGLVLSHYYVPFQIMMGDVRPFRTLAWTIAFYNISWGTGFAGGPLLEGYIGSLSKSTVIGATVIVAVIHTAVAAAAHVAPKRPSEQVHTEAAFTSTARMRTMGLLGVGACLLIVMGFGQTVWPGLGEMRGLTNAEIGLGVALLSIPTPILSLLWARLRRQFIKPWLLMASLLVAAAAAGSLGMTQTYVGAALCLTTIGAAISCVYFYGIYYANADPVNAHRSVSRYETIVGMGGVAGPVLLGSIAWNDPSAMRVYITCAAILAGAAVAVYLMREKEEIAKPQAA